MNYKQLKIKEFNFWIVYLHTNQYFLGRVYIWSKRQGLVDLMDITNEEREELFEIGRLLKNALGEIFHPDLFNWTSLGNLSTQCHIHLIPRYASTRNFAGLTFEDGRWGKNYAPYDYEFKIDNGVLCQIKDIIKGKL